MQHSVITLADEQVSIILVCRMLGVDLPEDTGSARSRKVPCPFGALYHSDGGVDPTMRIYPDSNSAYCFSCAAYYSPVSLAARGMDVDRRTAAARLLDRAGIEQPDLTASWQQASQYRPPPNRALLAEALKTFCRRVDPRWRLRQFDPDVADTLTRCLAILDLVSTSEDVELWLTRCKAAMRQVLICADASTSEVDAVSLNGSHPQKEWT